jgi:hypothetical protein
MEGSETVVAVAAMEIEVVAATVVEVTDTMPVVVASPPASVSVAFPSGIKAAPTIMSTRDPTTTNPACLRVPTLILPNGRIRLPKPKRSAASPSRIRRGPILSHGIGGVTFGHGPNRSSSV